MSVWAIAVLGLAAAMMAAWRGGMRRNHQLVLDTCQTLERVLGPLDTSYTNIGGVVGYNFIYRLDSPPFTRAEGSITTVPRQALLYYPISRVLGREDCLVMTLFCDQLPPGEGHIAEKRLLERGWIPIEDSDSLESSPVERDGVQFILLWYNRLVLRRLELALGRLENPATLRYIGYFGASRTITVRLRPVPGELERQLTELRSTLAEVNLDYLR